MTARADREATEVFPSPPMAGSKLLAPICSWIEMHQETRITGVEFDLFWYDGVADGVAYFFCWLGEPRSTVLVVWDDDGPTHIECRKAGDLLMTNDESQCIVAEVTHAFRTAGYWKSKTSQ